MQYASVEYVEELHRRGFMISMSRRGNPYDNATLESFFKTLKYEEVYLFDYETIGDVRKRHSFLIEEWAWRKPISLIGREPIGLFQ